LFRRSSQAMAQENNQEKKNIFVGMEEEVLAFWQKNKIFEKSVAKEAPRGEYVFYDGPPFATGTPHYGHLAGQLMKDAVPRFWTMNGYHIPRQWGWDCHGLPIENIVEKELGTKSKKEIEENIGVAKFNALCRSKVLSYAEDWEKIVKRLGRWIDMDHPYRTMDIDYMESIWWAFKQLWNNDLIYKDYRSMHICPRCETTLSQSEVAEGYKDVKDLSVTAKFELVDEPGTFVLAWTTTPWTLPGNVALAVGKEIDYVKVKFWRMKDGERLYEPNSTDSRETSKEEIVILAKERLKDYVNRTTGSVSIEEIGKVLTFAHEVIDNFKGDKLIGRAYKPLFDYYAKDEKLANRENGWKIYHADFVTTTDGTGIVHIAPAFGEDDMKVGRDNNLPFVQHVGMDGTFKPEMENLKGLHVKPKDDVLSTDLKILKYLQENNLYFSKAPYLHSYPFCWRCDTPLINYATSSWFVKITEMKPRMIELAEAINWSPEHIKTGRFGKWLEGARDWSISRQRFWASCMPIWDCACGAKKVLGSLEELYEAANGQITKLILVRHGEAENNVKNIISDKIDKYGLTEKGRKQIETAAEKIKTEIAGRGDKAVMFSSPILRARETAEIIAGKLGLKFETEKELREIELGSWDDQNEAWLSANDDLRKQNDKLPVEQQFSFRRGGDGENGLDVGKRVYAWLKNILEKNKGKIIVVVTHGDPIIDLINELKSRNEKEAAIAWSGPEYPDKGSVKVLYLDNSTKKEIDLHKDSVDQIILKCDICGAEMKRVPDVLDTWFDSGSMPYAQMHYPFENKERFEQNFPAEFIAEGVDQTRAWFYYLHVIAVGIRNNYAYKNVIVNGIVLAEDGKKMSKRLKNYPDPADLFAKYGADALRYYILTSPVMQAENLNFSEKGVADCLRKVNMILWNVYKFYEMYAEAIKNEKLKIKNDKDFEPNNILDKWIIERLNQLIIFVHHGMEKYDLPSATRPIAAFIDDFSTWYIRRSRDRFKEENADKNSALATTELVLTDLAKVMAPFTPFIAEQLWQKVTGNNFTDPEMSVHLEEWPNNYHQEGSGVKLMEESSVLAEMALARKVVELGLAKRDEAGIKVRQPLNQLKIKNAKLKIIYFELLKEELNVKEIVAEEGDGEIAVELDISMTPELIAEGLKRELVRFINAERKNADLTINDKIILTISTESEAVKNAVKLFEADLLKDVLAEKIIIGAAVSGKEVEANGQKLTIKINKI
jgi:isoleucyl-tRNA synthetase